MTESSVCPRCGHARTLVSREGRVQRGERTVTYTAPIWSCPGCADPETGERPFLYTDRALAQQGLEASRAAWQERYGEPLPPRGRPGRPRQEETREETVSVRLTSNELAQLDAERGEQPRGVFIRAKLFGKRESRAS